MGANYKLFIASKTGNCLLIGVRFVGIKTPAYKSSCNKYCLIWQRMRCYQGKPETNAGKSFSKLDVKAMGCISNPEVTHSLLTILIVLLVALMFILLYFNRRKVQDNVKPLIDNFQRSMQYKTIEKVSAFVYGKLS